MRVHKGDKNARLTMDMLESMPYTRAVCQAAPLPPSRTHGSLPRQEVPRLSLHTARGSKIIPRHIRFTTLFAYPEPETFDPEVSYW